MCIRDSTMASCYRGAVVSAPKFGLLHVLEDHSVGVDACGRISFVVPGAPSSEQLDILGIAPDEVRILSGTQFLAPGFIDTHIHAPQYSYTGTATDKPLMGPDGWLEAYTFPAERGMAQLEAAEKVYSSVIRRTLRHGTTTALYFGTVDIEACKLLADLCEQIGQRGFIGKVCMDRNCPDDYCDESAASALADTEALIAYCSGLGSGLVEAAITPRFIPTCTDELMEGLGKLAAKHGCVVQSHISESLDEVAYVRSLYPSDNQERLVTDTDILDRFGLLTDRCVMAHGVHLTDTDLAILRERGTAVAHCPLSNFFFAGGTLDAEKIVETGVKIGLGTDVAGGYSPAMLDSVRHAVVASKVVHNHGVSNTEGPGMDYRHAFYLGTQGGAISLWIDSQVGSIEAGKLFDVLLVDVAVGDNIDLWPADSPSSMFEKWCNIGDDRNIIRVFVNGRCVIQPEI
eukprot:TRINITY_DN21744_c0_g1_i1.p1 TRINITY_DN21744_c0_g1~~TRINITY_DN21744_c0_g1_i1.p1  ORF type:complete len:458 (+),score=71.60 TRINITY_DN21744_c0_g1_i1:85-1458(+)